MNPEESLERLEIELPRAPKAAGLYKPLLIHGGMAYFSGHLPLMPDGRMVTGLLGDSISLEEGAMAARLTGLNGVARLKFNGLVLKPPFRADGRIGYRCDGKVGGSGHVVFVSRGIFLVHLPVMLQPCRNRRVHSGGWLVTSIVRKKAFVLVEGIIKEPVSYTHLTLPTKA